jgi:hypothetical protein
MLEASSFCNQTHCIVLTIVLVHNPEFSRSDQEVLIQYIQLLFQAFTFIITNRFSQFHNILGLSSAKRSTDNFKQSRRHTFNFNDDVRVEAIVKKNNGKRF